MGMMVSAAEAGRLVDKHERIVRRRLARGDFPGAHKDARGVWRIPVDALASINGWTVDREALAGLEVKQRRSASGLVAQVEGLQAELRAAHAQLRTLERRIAALEAARLSGGTTSNDADGPVAPPEGASVALDYDDLGAAAVTPHGLLSASGDVLPDWPVSRAPRRVPTVALADRGPGVAQMFRTRTDAARWLERHGVNASTARHWPHWQTVGLTPAEVFAFALERLRDARAQGDYRVTWRLQRCDDPACICAEVLA